MIIKDEFNQCEHAPCLDQAIKCWMMLLVGGSNGDNGRQNEY